MITRPEDPVKAPSLGATGSPSAEPDLKTNCLGDRGALRLRGISAPVAGQTWEYTRELLRVGRLNTFELVLNDDTVSRRHAEVICVGANWAVRDLDSANGTFVNAARVRRVPVALGKGDVIQFGSVC